MSHEPFQLVFHALSFRTIYQKTGLFIYKTKSYDLE